MERPSRMLGEPGEHLRMFMGGRVVEDGVDHLAGRDGPLDGCDEADEQKKKKKKKKKKTLSIGAEGDPRIGAQKGPLFGDDRGGSVRPGGAGWGCAAGASAVGLGAVVEGQARFLKRQLSLPVSTMSQ